LQDLSLHILDIAENSIAAGARNVEIDIIEDLKRDLLIIEIRDDGKGMDRDYALSATSPFVTTRSERKVGFGLSLFAQAARMSRGELVIQARSRKGTKVRATFQHSHIDRQPLGNMSETLMTLIVGYPQADFQYLHVRSGGRFSFSSKELKAQLRGRPVTSPRGLQALRDKLKESLPPFGI
jgi:hypothetical protein